VHAGKADSCAGDDGLDTLLDELEAAEA